LRLPEDPADWLLKHSADEFRELLSGATTLLEYLFRRRAERARGAGAAERSRMMAEIQEVIGRIDDPVFYRDALRVAAEALGVSPQELQSGRRQRTAETPQRKTPAASPLEQAGREVLTLMLAHPRLTEELLEKGVRVPYRPHPFRLDDADFGDEAQASLFRLLKSHPGQALDSILADDAARERMDELVALGAEAEEMRQNDLHSSRGAARETWLRLGILSRQRAKRDTPDYDKKGELQAEMQVLKEALRAVSSGP
jgi:DNA primase